MKFAIAFLLLAKAQAFAPASGPLRTAAVSTTRRHLGVVDPTHFADLASQHIDSLQHAMSSSISLADAAEMATDAVSSAVDSASSAVDTVASTAAQTADMAGNAAQEVATTDNGWFGFLTVPIMGLLNLLHATLVSVGVSANAWGVSIILLTLLIKLATFPLTKQQLESTTKMQAMSPKIKEIQAKYQSNPEVMNQKIAEFYQVNEINPLAGCIPSLAQIPIFIGLYRAVLDLAKENALDEPFLFLPNLEGPTYGADPTHGSDWLFQGWYVLHSFGAAAPAAAAAVLVISPLELPRYVMYSKLIPFPIVYRTDGVPSLGWDDTISFLILPVFLVISQFISMELMQPKSDDPAQQQSNVILKVLPIMIGWFALNVPAALSVYWVVNNIVTTATSVFIRNNLKVEPVKTGGSAGSATMEPPATIFAPPREKPAGFAAPAPAPISSDSVTPLTAIDAEVLDDDDEDEDDVADTPSPSKPKKKRGKKGKKRKN